MLYSADVCCACRIAEVVRSCGPEEPPMRALMQNAYGKDWVSMNNARKVRAAAAC